MSLRRGGSHAWRVKCRYTAEGGMRLWLTYFRRTSCHRGDTTEAPRNFP
jgi:hypothetical protein